MLLEKIQKPKSEDTTYKGNNTKPSKLLHFRYRLNNNRFDK